MVTVLAALLVFSQTAPIAVSLDEPFTVGIGDRADVEGHLFLTFADVVRDSRCPVDVQCVRAGEALVVIEVQIEGEDAVESTFEVPPGGSVTKEIRGYEVTIESLDPPAESGRSLRKEDYRARMRVSRGENPPSVWVRKTAL